MDQSYHFKHNNTQTHLLLKGNEQGQILLHLHGGPGGNCAPFIHQYGNYFEPNFLMVYWEQRGSGKSIEYKGKVNISQFIEDLHSIITHIKAKYPLKKINLIGTSWGGSLGLLYLSKYTGLINSLITVGAVANANYALENLLKYEKDLLKTKNQKTLEAKLLKVPLEVEKWDFETMQLVKHQIPQKLKFNVFQTDTKLEYIPEPAYSKLGYDSKNQNGRIMNQKFWKLKEFKSFNILNKLKTISDPVLIIQGELDLVTGFDQGKLIFKSLCELEKKELFLIKGEGHRILKQKQDLVEKVETFIKNVC